MSDVKKRTVIFFFKSSIVAKGIEKSLKENGFPVSSEDIDEGESIYYPPDAELCIMYLPDDLLDNFEKQKKFVMIIDKIRDTRNEMIMIGNEDMRDDIMRNYPDVSKFTWVSRPVEPKKFCTLVENIMEKRMTKKRILIVDDDPSYAAMVRAWIKDTYKTDIVTAGMQAITFLLKNRVDLILLDYEMPVVDGPQVFQMLRQEDATKDIPVVFLTGVSTKEGVARVMTLKPDGYILKTTTRDEILGYLKKKLGV